MIQVLHTIYITYSLRSIIRYNELFKILTKNSNEVGQPFYPIGEKDNEMYETNYLSSEGLTRIILRKTKIKKKYRHPYTSIEIQLNPKRLICKDNKIKIMKDKDIAAVNKKFNSIIKSIDMFLPGFYQWTLKRVDYATYIKTPFVSDYIELFNKGDRPARFRPLLKYDKTKHRSVPPRGSFYLVSNGAKINFYNKQAERINKYMYSYDDIDNKELKDAKDILRFEVQCEKNKTNYLKKKYKFKTKELHNFLNLDISRKTIEYYYKHSIRTGDYYTYGKAIDIINNSNYSIRLKNSLIKTLKLINLKNSIYNARKLFIQGIEFYVNSKEKVFLKGTNKTFNNHLKLFDELGINPVTIERRGDIIKKLKDLGKESLINPINEMLNNMRREQL